MINKGMFTSKTDQWSTPQEFFDEVNKEFDFVLDVCCDESNCKAPSGLTEIQDGLSENWADYNGWKWMNPPYGREIGRWVKKASEERMVVALLPARTDTKYFHEYIYQKPNTEIRFIKGRLKFGDSKNSAPFPSMLVIFR